MKRTTVLLADDNPDMLYAVKDMLDRQFDVIATVPDGQSLVTAVREHNPDIIVSDVSMPGLSGIQATAEIRRYNPVAKIILLTVHRDRLLVNQGLTAGALGYVLKVTAGDELIPAIEQVMQGKRYVSPVIGYRDSGAFDVSLGKQISFSDATGD